MILKHRNRELLKFEWIESGGVRILSLEETNRKFLPIEFGEAVGKGREDLLAERRFSTTGMVCSRLLMFRR